MLTNKLITWPRFQGTNSSPAWSPDGSQIMFMSSMYGNPELFITDASGARPKRLTILERGEHIAVVESKNRATGCVCQ